MGSVLALPDSRKNSSVRKFGFYQEFAVYVPELTIQSFVLSYLPWGRVEVYEFTTVARGL